MESKVIEIQKYGALYNIMDNNKYNKQITDFTANIMNFKDRFRNETKNPNGVIVLGSFTDYLYENKNKINGYNYLYLNFDNFCQLEILDSIPEMEVLDALTGTHQFTSLEKCTKAVCEDILYNQFEQNSKSNKDINFGVLMNSENSHYYALNVRYYNNELYLTWADSKPLKLPTNEVIQKMASILSKYINAHGGKVSKIISSKLSYKDTLRQNEADRINCGPYSIINAHRMSIQSNNEFVENIKAKIKECKEYTILQTDDISNKEEMDNKKDNVQDKYSSVPSLNPSQKTCTSIKKKLIRKVKSKQPIVSNNKSQSIEANKQSQSPEVNNTININSNPVLNTKKEQEKIDNSVVSKKSVVNSKENQQIVPYYYNIVEDWVKSLKSEKNKNKSKDKNDITKLIYNEKFMRDIYGNIDMYYKNNKNKLPKEEKDNYVKQFLAELKPSNNGNSSHVSSIKKKSNNNDRSI